MRLTRNVIFIFLAVFIIGATFLYWLWQGYQQRRDEIIAREQAAVANQYSSTINSYRLVSQSLYDEVLNSEVVTAIISQADAGDHAERQSLRAQLYQRFLPVFNRLQAKNFKQLHFHLEGGVSFLRLQAPDKFGDELLSARPSLKMLNETPRYIEGFEEDKFFSGFHYLFPLYQDKKFIGSVETSVSFSTFKQQMSQIFPLTYQFLIKKNVLDDQVFEDSSRYYYLSDLNRSYFYENEPSLNKRVDNVLPEDVTTINEQLKNKVAKRMLNGAQFSEYLQVKRINYLVTFIPIKNIGGNQVAYLISYNKDDSISNLQTDLINRSIFIIALILVVLAFILFVSDNQNKLLDAGERIKNITTAMGEGLMVVDKNGIIIFFNKSASVLTGHEAQQVIGQPYYNNVKYVGEYQDLPNDAFIKQILKKGGQIFNNKDVYLLNSKRERIPVSINASALKNKEHQVIGCIVVFRDVSEERAIDKAKTEFVSLASHQLKTPLSAVNWYTEMLMDQDVGSINERQHEFLKEILEGNQRMVKLVNSLLNVSRIDMGTLSISPEPVDIVEMTDSMLNELQYGIKAKDLKIIKRYEGNFPKINLDPSLMRVVVQNLLSNAVKYTREGGLIEVEVKKQDDQTAFMLVRDNGYGIPKAEQSNIFKKLFRADNVKSKKVEGTGLGLYVAKAVIEAFEGKIWFESEENKGTSFYITLPLKGVTKKEGTKGLEANT